MVKETDAQAVSLGYAADSSKVDPKKYPKHAATQMCSGCQLYTGKAGEASHINCRRAAGGSGAGRVRTRGMGQRGLT